MEETDIEPTANPDSLSIKDYKLEFKNNSEKEWAFMSKVTLRQ